MYVIYSCLFYIGPRCLISFFGVDDEEIVASIGLSDKFAEHRKAAL
jgi:hypothetical protein